jgi:hypothetical protein
MLHVKWLRAGILFAIAAAGSISCGETSPTVPNPKTGVIAVPASEQFLNSAQQESRELLIDGRVTNIEWDIAGNPSIILVQGDNPGSNYYVSVRSVWTKDRFGAYDGFLLLLQWADRTENRLEHPLICHANALADAPDTVINAPGDTTFIAIGDTLTDCHTGDNTLVRESSWSRSPAKEDQVTIDFYSDSLGSYPADVWRWGAETTDPATPVNETEFTNAGVDGDNYGSTYHPGAGWLEDSYDTGSGPIRDAGHYTYEDSNTLPGSNVPRFIASKGTRDTRLNRAKPVEFVLWKSVAKPMGPCEVDNPIRLDNAGERDKTWNPEDYVPSFLLSLPDSTTSQADVIGKGAWTDGKWALEIRRDLVTRSIVKLPGGILLPPWTDDVQMTPGRTYSMRISIFDGTTGATSRSGLIPVYLRP